MNQSLGHWLRRIERLHPREIELGLARVRRVAGILGVARPANCVVTVAGTNGKGSCVALLEAVALQAGVAADAQCRASLRRAPAARCAPR